MQVELLTNLKVGNMKKIIAIFALLYSSLSFSATIPTQYIGEWAVNCDADNKTLAIFETNYFNPDSDYGMAKLSKLTNEADGSHTLYEKEEYWDEGQNFGGKSKINVRLEGSILHMVGSHHQANYNLRLEKCGTNKPFSRLSLFNIRIRMTVDEVENVSFFRCLGTKCELTGGQPTIDGEKIYPSIFFDDDDKIEVVQIAFDRASQTTIESVLNEKFGSPTKPLQYDEPSGLYLTEWIIGNEHIKIITHTEENKPFYVILERLDQAQREKQRSVKHAKSVI